ncbi:MULTISPECIES: hypothetical protein [Aphanothece]|uniref:hypothetical protein n=1 Tax=Aphanothece TaxID=1121 RepID=UPI003984CEE3
MQRNPVQDFLLFLVGGSLFGAGIFLFTNQVMVGSALRFGLGRGGGYGAFFTGTLARGVGDGFGLLMLPLGVGVCLLFAGRWSKAGWFLIWASLAAVGVGVLQSLFFSFRETSLWSLLTMVVLMAAGGGLMFRSLGGYDSGNGRGPDS